MSYVYTCTLINRHDNQVWRSDTTPARVSDSPCRHTEAAAGGAGSVRGRLGSGAGVRGSEVWLGVEVGAARPIVETVVKPAGSKQRGALLRTFLHPADPQGSVQDKQELLWGQFHGSGGVLGVVTKAGAKSLA